MSNASRVGLLFLFGGFLTCAAFAQMKAQLRTTDSEVALEASPEAPRLASLQFPGQPSWMNRTSEVLIRFVEVSGAQAACNWTFNAAASHIDKEQVAFVYDSARPHLRLSWEWRARQAYGPLEHQIRIENLDSRELWIPMQDSLAFDWQVDPKAPLQQLFVEKGANTP